MKKTVVKEKRYKRKQRNTSIFFLLWAVFSVMALFITLLFGLSQHYFLEKTHKEEIARDLVDKGIRIEKALTDERLVGDIAGINSYVRYLSWANGVDVMLLNGQGEVLYPFDESGTDIGVEYDFKSELATLKSKLSGASGNAIAYEDGDTDNYVYGNFVKVSGVECYLYITTSLALVEGVGSQMVLRTVMLSLFVLVLAFAVSSAISGWITKPITEMSDKAKRFARGDFSVDFHGSDYGAEMVELAHSLNFAKDEIGKADRMQKDLIANVSHDFKTPLTMIKAYSSMIIEISGDNPEKRNKHAQVIVDEADRLTSLVEDVLDLSKLSSGIAALQMKRFDLSAYAYDVLDRFEYLKETQGYVFKTEIEDGVFVYADEGKIGQVLYNLIGNAVNYTGEDKTVTVRIGTTGYGVARFSVIDTGKGISEEEKATIWERYYRSKETHKRPVKGTGLGLSIVRTILEKHGFLFGVESEKGKGSTFFVDFPKA